ncbi:hypothetical protein [Cryobacterium ruanii]|uniref:Uncharacterized protein n=1 Tax=Cryobacterium ruanii TaxID=1259197 RepID=A0A4R9AS54_9MICO|nr:hypothetical protein [Cryobacterium ruanii]TFD67976.1 hypothetical protein E3T47_05125 [Cryobacterium ruanii]
MSTLTLDFTSTAIISFGATGSTAAAVTVSIWLPSVTDDTIEQAANAVSTDAAVVAIAHSRLTVEARRALNAASDIAYGAVEDAVAASGLTVGGTRNHESMLWLDVVTIRGVSNLKLRGLVPIPAAAIATAVGASITRSFHVTVSAFGSTSL